MHLNSKIAILTAVAICAAGILWMSGMGRHSESTRTYSQFLEKVRAGQIASVTVMDRDSGAVQADFRLKDGTVERTVLPADYRDAMAAMEDQQVDVEIRDSSPQPFVMKAAPFLVLLGVWIILLIGKCGRPPLAWTS